MALERSFKHQLFYLVLVTEHHVMFSTNLKSSFKQITKSFHVLVSHPFDIIGEEHVLQIRRERVLRRLERHLTERKGIR